MNTLSDVLRESGLSYRTLVKYTEIGLLSKPQRVWRGRKGSESIYPDDIIDRIKTIQELKAQGKSLAQIKEIMPIFLSNQEFVIPTMGNLEVPPEVEALMNAIADFGLKQWVERKKPGYTLDSVTMELIEKDGRDFYRITKVNLKPKDE